MISFKNRFYPLINSMPESYYTFMMTVQFDSRQSTEGRRDITKLTESRGLVVRSIMMKINGL